jgi:hypothetical protein
LIIYVQEQLNDEIGAHEEILQAEKKLVKKILRIKKQFLQHMVVHLKEV